MKNIYTNALLISLASILYTGCVDVGSIEDSNNDTGSSYYAHDTSGSDQRDNTPQQGTTTLQDLIKTKEILQNQHYKKTYNGGTDIKTFTVKDSKDKVCSVNVLDSTEAFNPYADQPYDISVRDRKEGLYRFSIMWQYGTSEGSHVDFYVDCTNQAQTPVKKQTLSEKYSLNIPAHSKETDWIKDGAFTTKVLFFDDRSLNGTTSTYTIKLTTPVWDFTDSAWSGFSAKVNDKLLTSFDSTSDVNIADVDEILFSYDSINHTATVALSDGTGTVIKTATVENVQENKYGDVKFSYFIGDIKKDSDELFFNEDSSYTYH